MSERLERHALAKFGAGWETTVPTPPTHALLDSLVSYIRFARRTGGSDKAQAKSSGLAGRHSAGPAKSRDQIPSGGLTVVGRSPCLMDRTGMAEAKVPHQSR
jgi:hypothetical protein